jgi:hypothetical protein
MGTRLDDADETAVQALQRALCADGCMVGAKQPNSRTISIARAAGTAMVCVQMDHPDETS